MTKVKTVMILDRSGSMSALRDDVVGGFNEFKAEQLAEGNDILATVVQFDHEYIVTYDNVALSDIPDLDATTYVPRGSTSLMDAIGRTINDVGAKLAAMSEADRPDKVIVFIYTDGQENTSKEFTRENISVMINHQETKYDWDFVFMAANQDAFEESQKFGITDVGKVMNYAPTGEGVKGTYAASSNLVSKAVRGQAVRLTDEEKAKFQS